MRSLTPVEIPSTPQFTLADQPAPIIDWVKVADMVIDSDYQRPLQSSNWQVIGRIAKSFSRSRFSPVILAPVEGGKYAVIDGQHRIHAAALCGIEAVPAMIVPIDRKTQAKAFVEINSCRISVSPINVYRAALIAQEDWAVAAQAAVSAAGCVLMTQNYSTNKKRPGQVFCISLIRKQIAAGRADVVTNTLTAIRRYDEAGSVPLYSDLLLLPLMSAVTKCDMGISTAVILQALRARKPLLVVDMAYRYADTHKHTSRVAAATDAFGVLLRDALVALKGEAA